MADVLDMTGLRVATRAGAQLVRGVDVTVAAGEVLALVGESGSGKSLSCLAIAGLLPRELTMQAQRWRIGGRDMSPDDPAALSGAVGVVFQNPLSSLNPIRTVGATMVEAFRAPGETKSAAQARAEAALDDVGVPPARMGAFPHQLSGGQRQRIMIALATGRNAKLVIADEPTTALDTTTQQQVLLLLRARLGDAAALVVTHDLGVAAQIADRIAVMYHGRIVEIGRAAAILSAPAHPYTQGLLAALPRLAGPRTPLKPIPGAPPDASVAIAGCAFAARCDRVQAACAETPPLAAAGASSAACWFAA